MEKMELRAEDMEKVTGGIQDDPGAENAALRAAVKEYKAQGMSLREILTKFPVNKKVWDMITSIYNEV